MNAIKLVLGSAAVLLVLTACPAEVPPDPVVPTSAVVKSFTVTPAQVEPGGEVTLAWDVQDAKSVSISTVKGSAAAIPASTAATGSVKVTVEEPSVFVLTASGEGGGDSAAAAVAITGAEQPVLFATIPDRVTAGEPVTLVWNAPSLDQVTISDASGTQLYSGDQTAGSITVTPAGSTSYTLTGGGRTASAAVAVTPALFAFTATPSEVEAGSEVVLSWKVGGAESVTLSSEGRGDLTTVTGAAQIADGTFTDTTPAVVPAFGLVTYKLTARLGDQVVMDTLEVFVGSDPSFKDVTVPEFAKEGALFTVNWQTAFADRLHIFIDGQQVFTATSKSAVDAGSASFPTPSAAIQVELRATNDRGGAASETFTVSPVGATAFVSFDANPAVIANGGEVTMLSWNVTNARRARVFDDLGRLIKEVTGVAAENGSVEAYPNRRTVYTLHADNTVGDAIPAATVTVDLTAPAQLVFDPAPVPAGANVQITGSTVANGGAMRAINFAVKDSSGNAFVDITSTGTALPFVSGNDNTALLATFPSPFETSLFGVPIAANGVSVSVDGWLVLGNAASQGTYGFTPPLVLAGATSLEPFAICVWADDLVIGPNTSVLWRIDGTGAQQRLIVQWNDVYPWASTGKSMTMQAQVYASGEVVLAYQTWTGMTTSDTGSMGIVNANETGAVQLRADQLVGGVHPAAGDGFEFFDLIQPPITVPATRRFSYVVEQVVANGKIEISTEAPTYDLDHFAIQEINYNPATGKEQWFEVENHTATPVELAGWELDFGNSQTHVIAPTSGSLILPANGRLLFGQSADSAEASSGGPAVDYIYGTALTMPATSAGYVALRRYGVEYTRSAWTGAGTQGTATIFQPDGNIVYASTSTPRITCASSGTYGASGQVGSPGAANAMCFKWRKESSTRAFQPIAATGQVVGTMSSTTLNGIDSVTTPLNFVALGGREVKIGTVLFGNATKPLYVSSNGWIGMVTTTSTTGANPTVPSTGVPNGVLALFWDDLAGNTGSTTDPSGVYWQQFDPDNTPTSGDEYTLISYENWRRWSSSINSSLNFQLRIDETTGDVEYVYGNMTSDNGIFSNGADATIWLEADTGAYALKYLANEAYLKPNTALRFKVTP